MIARGPTLAPGAVLAAFTVVEVHDWEFGGRR
jgi:hypothetical protein